MNEIVLTGWAGSEWNAIAAVTSPLICGYARRHKMDFSTASLDGDRSPSWMKVPNILRFLERYDAVLWVDADVVIEDGSRCILDEISPNAWQALVQHETECGAVPNCGVWVVRKQMKSVLQDAWSCGECVDHPWWEQAAIMKAMGYAFSGVCCTACEPTELTRRTHFLGNEWNDHPQDSRRAKTVLFRHVTQYADRLSHVVHFAGNTR